MSEELLCHPLIEIGNGHPWPGGIPTAPRTQSMDMWMKSSGFTEGLNDGDHARAKAVFFESGGAHELGDGVVSASGKLAEKLAVVEKVDPEHLWDRENHDYYWITALQMVTDPSTVRYEERVAAGKATINGVSIADLEKTVEVGKKLMKWWVDHTVALIRESIGPAPSSQD